MISPAKKSPKPALTGVLFALLTCGGSHPWAHAQSASPFETLSAESLPKDKDSARTHPAGQDPSTKNPPNQNQPSAPDPNKKPKRKFDIYLGPDVGGFFPTNSKTRDRFGSSWIDLGPSIGAISRPRSHGKLDADIQLLTHVKNDNYIILGLVGIEYRKALVSRKSRGVEAPKSDRSKGEPGDSNQKPPADPQPGDKGNPKDRKRKPDFASQFPTQPLVPYFGLRADLAVGDLRSIEDNVHSGVRTGAVGTAFLGLNYKNRAYMEARYTQTTVIKGFDLSGFGVQFGFRIRF